jgi:hypothetical protein
VQLNAVVARHYRVLTPVVLTMQMPNNRAIPDADAGNIGKE